MEKREISRLSNRIVICREVQINAFGRTFFGKLMMSRWTGQHKHYYQMPTSCPPVHIKLAGDIEMRGLDHIVMAYSSQNGMDKLCVSVLLLPRMLTTLRNLNSRSTHPHYVGDVKIEGLDAESFKVSTSGLYGKSFIMKFAHLKDLVTALDEAQLFVQYYDRMLQMRDHIVCSYQVNLQDDSYNSCNREVNVARLITHYNTYMKVKNCNVPWDLLIDNIVSKMCKSVLVKM